MKVVGRKKDRAEKTLLEAVHHSLEDLGRTLEKDHCMIHEESSVHSHVAIGHKGRDRKSVV